MAYTTDIDLSHFWRLKSEIEVLVDSVSDEHVPPGLQMATFLGRGRERLGESLSLPFIKLRPVGLGLLLVTSFDLHCLLKAQSPNESPL